MKICLPTYNDNAGPVPRLAINQAYVLYVLEAGMSPMLIPCDISGFNRQTPIAENKNYVIIEEAAATSDGLLLPGGVDIDPTYYGEQNIASYTANPERDAFERFLLHAFIKAGKKIFGICRGFQLITREYMSIFRKETAFWLTYHQHISHHEQIGGLRLGRNVLSHDVIYNQRELYSIQHGTKEERQLRMFVNSMHHQAVTFKPKAINSESSNKVLKKKNNDRINYKHIEADLYLSNNEDTKHELNVVACTKHGVDSGLDEWVVEGVRGIWGSSKILAVQWHPEEIRDHTLLHNFFKKDEKTHPEIQLMGAGAV